MGPPFISHEVPPFGRGPTTRSLGDLRSPWLLPTYKSWDDPPSDSPIPRGEFEPVCIAGASFWSCHNSPKQNFFWATFVGQFTIITITKLECFGHFGKEDSLTITSIFW